jgi:hypothetical protein
VWKSVGLMTGQNYAEVPIVFEDVRFHRATSIPKQGLCNNVFRYTVSACGKSEWWCSYFCLFHQYVQLLQPSCLVVKYGKLQSVINPENGNHL